MLKIYICGKRIIYLKRAFVITGVEFKYEIFLKDCKEAD